MARRKRWFWVLAVGLLLLIVAGLIAVSLIDVERFRDKIEASLEEATGWEAELGALDLSVLRGLAVTVEPASLTAPDGTSRAAAQTISVRGKLWPLLKGRLEIDSIALVKPEVLLVRPDEARGFVLPKIAPERSPATAAAALTVSIGGIDLIDGMVTIEDRTVEPAKTLSFSDVDLAFTPETGALSGDGQLGGVAEMGVRGDLESGFNVTLEDVPAAELQPFVGADLLHDTGTVDGTIRVTFPLKLEGTLTGEELTLLSGTTPFEDDLDASFVLSQQGQAWTLDRFDLDVGGIGVSGSGPVMPSMDVTLAIAEMPLQTALEASESVLPLPLDLEGPGSFEAQMHLGDGGFSADGTLSAAEYRIADELPVAEGVKTKFRLSEAGQLVVDIVEGSVAGGAVSGRATIDSVQPLGNLTLDGDIRDAVLGALIGPMVTDAATKVDGATGLEADLGIDLSREFDLKALKGTVELGSRKATLPGWDLESAIEREIESKLESLGDIGDLLKQKLGRSEAPAATEKIIRQVFDSLDARIDFDTWPWTVESLTLSAPGLTAEGRGTYEPIAGEADFVLTARLDAARTAELVAKERRLKRLVDRDGRLAFPVTVHGPLMGPRIGVDLGEVLKLQLGDDDPEDKLKGLLKDLVGG